MDEKIKERLIKSPFVTKQIRDDVQILLSNFDGLSKAYENRIKELEEGIEKLSNITGGKNIIIYFKHRGEFFEALEELYKLVEKKKDG